MIEASISKIESMGLVDGPGIRTVVFLNNCKLRCKYCHNPETWNLKDNNYTVDQLIDKIKRNKPYFQKNGGVTFSGGEPLLHYDFLVEVCKKLKEEDIHIALDTAGIGNGNYEELLNLIDLIILDIKHITKEGFKDITQTDNYDKFEDFLNQLNKSGKDIWIRQVIIPGVNDNKDYIKKLSTFIVNKIRNVKNVEFLPFHTMAFNKYKELNIKNYYNNKEPMDKEVCNNLLEYYKSIQNEVN